MAAKEHRYRVRMVWSGAAQGSARDYTSYSREHLIEIDGKAAIRGSSDPSFRGDRTLHNPEELLVSSISACHMLWYLHLCTTKGIEVVAYEDRAEGTMVQDAGGGRFSEVMLRPRVTIRQGGDEAVAAGLHTPASKACFIANSVNFPIHHEAEILSVA